MQPPPDSRSGRVLIRDGALSVEIAPDCGGAITRFEVAARGARGTIHPVLRRALDSAIDVRSPYGASSFSLLPYASRLREGRFEFRGRRFEFPINAPGERHSYHGDGWLRPWRVIAIEAASATLELTPDPIAPVQYQATQTFELADDALTVEIALRNEELFAIPVGIGIHPYFALRSSARLTANLPVRWRMDAELLPVGKDANPQAEQMRRGIMASALPVGAAYSGWDGSALIDWPDADIRVRILTRPALSHAVVWAPDGETFFCFEPVSHETNAFNLAREGIPAESLCGLEPGEVLRQRFTFAVHT